MKSLNSETVLIAQARAEEASVPTEVTGMPV